METGVAKRYLKMTHDIDGYDGYSFCSETEQLAVEVIELHKAIAIYCREELGNMNFETDEEAINYFKAFARKFNG
jgi:hypothetical protein